MCHDLRVFLLSISLAPTGYDKKLVVVYPALTTVCLHKLDAPQIWVTSCINKLWICTVHKIKLFFLTMQNNSLVWSFSIGRLRHSVSQWIPGVPHQRGSEGAGGFHSS